MDSFDHKRFEDLFSIWSEARRQRALPRLNDTRIENIGEFIRLASILEKINGHIFIFRLIGQRIVTGVGTELTNLNILDLVASHEVTNTKANFNAILDQPCGSLCSYSADYSNGVETNVESLSLPVVDEGGKPRLILSVNVTSPDLALDQLGAGVVIGSRYSKFDLFDLGFGLP